MDWDRIDSYETSTMIHIGHHERERNELTFDISFSLTTNECPSDALDVYIDIRVKMSMRRNQNQRCMKRRRKGDESEELIRNE